MDILVALLLSLESQAEKYYNDIHNLNRVLNPGQFGFRCCCGATVLTTAQLCCMFDLVNLFFYAGI